MKLTRYKLGEFIEEISIKNKENKFKQTDVVGLSIKKEFIPTKANLKNVDLKKYKILFDKIFAFVPVTSRNGNKISIAYNNSGQQYLISSVNILFKVNREDILLSDYLYMYFNRPEFDRYARFNSWGSARETFNWSDMCDIDIELPSIDIQQKYVDIYNGMNENIEAYESGLEDLKLVCDAYMNVIKHKYKKHKIGNFIKEINVRNEDFKINNPKGIDINSGFIEPKRIAENSKSAKIVKQGQFAFNKVIKSNGTRIPIAYREDEPCTISSSYYVFEVIKRNVLEDGFLMLWLKRSETQRYTGYISGGSSRDTINFENFCEIEIPIPPLEIQQNIADIYNVYNERKKIAEELKELQSNMCPILIKGAIEEATR